MDAPCPSLSKRSNACLISVRWSSVSVSSVVFLGFGGITRNVCLEREVKRTPPLMFINENMDTWFPGRTAIREAEPAAVVMAIIDGPKGSGAFALAQHIANQTDLIMIDDSQLPFGAK